MTGISSGASAPTSTAISESSLEPPLDLEAAVACRNAEKQGTQNTAMFKLSKSVINTTGHGVHDLFERQPQNCLSLTNSRKPSKQALPPSLLAITDVSQPNASPQDVDMSADDHPIQKTNRAVTNEYSHQVSPVPHKCIVAYVHLFL
jgi:hypothetical protein